MKREDRAKNPAPAGDFYRTDIVPRFCAREGCENAVRSRRTFCSSECFGISRRKHEEHDPIPIELVDDMQAALDALRAYAEEGHRERS